MWEATFTSLTPAEPIAAFLTDLASPEPLDPDRDDPLPPRSPLPPIIPATAEAFPT
ncbi:DUF317 domain-containing protein [Actinomadura adrarensis]|uniref:DUF317 domain-containing protein n=1 Tax=Actinomadura adrarensis TaxID=1819600 RepID=A0ABW3CNR9_9ACTN